MQWLAQDLAALGWPWPAHAATADPCAGLHLPDALAALGSLFVVEGSALGGQVIVRRLGTQAALAPALRYFQGHGEATRARWRRFCALLAEVERECSDTPLPGPPRWCSAVQAAQATFDALCHAAAGPPAVWPEARA